MLKKEAANYISFVILMCVRYEPGVLTVAHMSFIVVLLPPALRACSVGDMSTVL